MLKPSQLVEQTRAGARFRYTTPFKPGVAGNDNFPNSLEMSVVCMVGLYAGVSPRLLVHPGRCRAPVAHARQLAMYLLHVVARQSMENVGIFFGRARATVSHACARVEDRRDSPDFDTFVTELETRVATLVATNETPAGRGGAGHVHH